MLLLLKELKDPIVGFPRGRFVGGVGRPGPKREGIRLQCIRKAVFVCVRGSVIVNSGIH